MEGITPQQYTEILKCNSCDTEILFAAVQYTVAYVNTVGQEASSSKCVLLSTSKTARERLTAWRNGNAGCFWAVKFDVRDLGRSSGCDSVSFSWYSE